ncbi:hypothetical protein EU537_04880 [Candidatus Thorarchaeota archaeon]|nr:MAG: hypothetical protein EU537_04880 [Candidatus Thorarchaeota archaeon]
MGRTARTFRDAVDKEESRWKAFSRTLKVSQREQLQRMFDYARACADAGTMMVTPRTTEVVLVASIIGLLEEIEQLRLQLEELKNAEE